MILNIIEWICTSDSRISVQLVNISVVCVLSVFLYVLHVWAGGDCKLAIVISVLIPYDFYVLIVNQWVSLILIFAFSFAFSYVFLIFDSVCSGIKRKQVVSIEKLFKSVKVFFIRYIACVSYIAFVNQIFALLFPDTVSKLSYVFLIINICISFIVGGIKVLQNKFVVAIIAIAVVVLKIYQKQAVLNKFMLINYMIVFLMLLLRLFIDEYNYETIPTKSVKKGMILSASTIVLFSASKVKGLPVSTSENLNSRLTQDEVESIYRWEYSKYGSDTVQIVRKIPFAIFISAGTIVYLILGAIMK